MHVTYVMTTILAALANGYAASLNFVGAESVKVVADRVQDLVMSVCACLDTPRFARNRAWRLLSLRERWLG